MSFQLWPSRSTSLSSTVSTTPTVGDNNNIFEIFWFSFKFNQNRPLQFCS
ncbi:hypothetical protein RchiOBHm_Chr4g0417591 [Rosa chinensis]|uniref:Uncharacterized protein n=1 Tax=Rosa chinensis TaxID=74649 RepID=A0A2P6QX52_ROSCH|nr:hypothetical protein RchiOBHm_Chr4g0417591 [Rosa chinensis]